MKKEGTKQFIRWCILGAVGCGFMATGDWLLGCIPLQETDTGLFNRACYLSGSYGLWRPVLTVGLGAIGGFLYYFVVKALNADINEKYRKTKTVQFLCGIFTVAIALTIHTWVATMAWFVTYLGPRIGAEAALAAVTAYQDEMLPAILPLYLPMLLLFGIHFVMLVSGKTRYPKWMLAFHPITWNLLLAHSLNVIGTRCLVVEMGVGMRLTKSYGEQLVDGILNLMHTQGMWAGETKPPRKPIVSKDEVAFINADKAGIFIPSVEHNGIVKKGQELAVIADPLTGEVRQTLMAPADGLLFTLREYPVVYPGSLLARILTGGFQK